MHVAWQMTRGRGSSVQFNSLVPDILVLHLEKVPAMKWWWKYHVWFCMMMSKSMAFDGIRWHATDDNKCQHCFAAAKQSPFAPPLAVNVTAGPKNTAEATWTGSADVWQPARNLVLEWRAYKLRMLFGVWSPFMPFIPRQCWWLMASNGQNTNAQLQPGILQTSRPRLSPVMLWWKWLRWTREKYFVNLRDLRLEHKPQWKSLTSSVMSWTRCEAEKTTWYIWHSILFILYDIISYHLVLYCILLYCIVLYYILYYIYGSLHIIVHAIDVTFLYMYSHTNIISESKQAKLHASTLGLRRLCKGSGKQMMHGTFGEVVLTNRPCPCFIQRATNTYSMYSVGLCRNTST